MLVSLKELTIFLSVIAYGFALHGFLPNDSKKGGVYTNFVPPSAERFFATAGAPALSAQQLPTTASAKAVAGAPFASPPPPSSYFAPYAYQPQYPQYPQYPPFAYKQYPYYPGAFYPPQQYVYPGPIGPSPVYYVQRYPAPAESGNEQGGSASGSGWGSYFPTNWQQWFPASFLGGSGSSESAEGSSPGTPAVPSQGSAPSSSSNKARPEKIENAESAPAQDSGKTETEKNTVAAVQLPEQQYILLGQPQFFGQFAGFPADRDPTTLNDAAKGAVSSFLFHKDQNQQIVPEKVIEIPNGPGVASVAYQRFLLLSKQRSEEAPKPLNKSESPQTLDSQNQKDSVPQTVSNDTGAGSNLENSPNKSSDGTGTIGDIAQVTPNAVAYAGIGGTAGAAPVGTAFIATNGLASSAPRATAIAGTSEQSPDFSPVPATRKFSIARYTPQRKYHIDTTGGELVLH